MHVTEHSKHRACIVGLSVTKPLLVNTQNRVESKNSESCRSIWGKKNDFKSQE